MTSIVPFDSGALPVAISQIFGDPSSNDLIGNTAGTGFPVVSIKGKVFHISRGGEKTLITKPGEDDPAASIEVVVIKTNPNRSKVFYASGYVEGVDAKPTCYSNSGVQPEADAEEPQSVKCATCEHNQWGSRMSDSGKKGKACSDSRRLAIATVDTPADPMLIRVPAASMKSLEEYGKILAARGVRPEAVVTRIGFDYSVAHPQLSFKPVGLINDARLLAEIKAASDSTLAAQIIGVLPSPAGPDDAPAATPSAQAPATPVAPPPAAPKATVAAKTVTTADAPPTAPKPAAKPVALATAATVASLEAQIAGMLDSMSFDDGTPAT